MASDLLSIAASGARAARGALDVTAQNIANASTDGYARRDLRLAEVSASGGMGRINDISLSGSRISEIHRNADSFLQSEVRRTGGDLQRANTELSGLKNIQSSLEQTGVFDSIVNLEASLQQLSSNPVDSSQRASVLANASTLANNLNITSSGLDAAVKGLQFDADANIADANIIGGELARVNLKLTRAGPGSSDRASLLDQRDQLLERLSGYTSISTSIASDGTVAVSLGANPPLSFVQGGTAGTLSSTVAANGTLSFAVDGQTTDPGSGSLAGASLALNEIDATRSRLDKLANDLATTFNSAQAAGVDRTGAPGQPIFSGTTAATLKVVMQSGQGLATAAAGEPVGSRDSTNLDALRQSLSTLDPAQNFNGMLFDISSKVSGREVTQSALETIASSAKVSLQEQSGVDLDAEAANLIRFQQAFQASGRAMQVASDVFNTLLGIGR
jgi:flagellar hook-associated protein 1 FlgK